ncbi:hypothetical protein ACFE04_024668 [Oxalis oulophora]
MEGSTTTTTTNTTTSEFQEWELLLPNSNSVLVNSPESTDFQGIEAESEGMIRSDYFSLTNNTIHVDVLEEEEEEGSVESDNPSWIDPDSGFQRNNSAQFWSDSASDRSDKVTDFDAINDLGIQGFEGKSEMGTYSDSHHDDDVSNIATVTKDEAGDGQSSGTENAAAVEEIQSKEQSGGEINKGMWWKAPIEVMKYCLFKFSPVWSFSVAAAVMGIVILGRRLYKMKRKTPGLELKLAVDDKKVSQFMNRVARLNEAFSVGRRAPMGRPTLPAVGLNNAWPMMSLR